MDLGRGRAGASAEAMDFPSAERWKALGPLFDELLDLAPAERAQRLRTLARADAVLADELSALLQSGGAADAQGFLLQGAPLAETARLAVIGRRIGAYRIDAELGEGTHGTTWRARRDDGRFEAVVAIKLLHRSLPGPADVQRFQRRGLALARLSHPQLARLLEAGVTPEGQPYCVYEHVDGLPIDTHCDAARLGVAQRLRLLLSVMDVVSHGHGQLVVHQGLKPANILVGSDGRPRLLDFGLAGLLADDDPAVARPPAGVAGRGTLHAAPEPWNGGPVSTATDVHALGVLACCLLVGRHPTNGGRTQSADVIRTGPAVEAPQLTRVLLRIAAPDEADVSTLAAARGVSPARLARQVRGDLEAIVARALRPAPAERYPSVDAFAADLRRHLAHEPVPARPTPWLRRFRVPLAAGAALTVSLLAGLAMLHAQVGQAARERGAAQRELADVQASRELLLFLLSERSAQQPMRPELLERGERMVERRFADDPEQRVRLHLLLAELYGDAAAPLRAESLLQQAQGIAAGLPDVALKMQIECLLAQRRVDSGVVAPALPRFDAAIAALRAAPRADRGVLAVCLNGRAQALERLGRVDEAHADALAAVATLGAPRPGEQPLAIALQQTQASLQARLRHPAEAVATYRRLLVELQALGRANTPTEAGLYNNLGFVLAHAGQTLQAAEAFQQGRRAAHENGGPSAVLLGNSVRVLTELGQPQAAMPLVDAALASADAARSDSIEGHLAAYGAAAACAAGDAARCAMLLRRAHAAFERTPPADAQMRGYVEAGFAQLALLQGDAARAKARWQRAVALLDAVGDRRLVIDPLLQGARLDAASGNLDGADAAAARALALARELRQGFAHNLWIGQALVVQGRVAQARGDVAAARLRWQAAQVELAASLGDDAPPTDEVRRLLAALPAG